eukprot:g22611.t1
MQMQAVHSGYLNVERKGKVISPFFALQVDSLERHESKEDFESGKDPRGTQPFAEIERLTARGNRFMIGLRNQTKPLELFVDNQEEFAAWTRAFEDLLKKQLDTRRLRQGVRVLCEGDLLIQKKSKEERRYCILRTDVFEYFLSETEFRAGAAARCRALMEDITAFEVTGELMKVTLGERTLELKALSPEDRAAVGEVERALMYLSRSLDESWISEHDDAPELQEWIGEPRNDWPQMTSESAGESALSCKSAKVAYYFRLPMAFMEAGHEAEARRALEIAARYVRGNRGSSKKLSMIYPQRFMASGRFFIRWTWADGFIERVEDPLYCVSTSGEQQLYFLMGLPTAVLLEVATSFRSLAESAKQKYRSVAEELLRYLKGCKNFFTAPTAYGTACAAAMLGDKESTDRLRRCMVALQQKDGSFLESTQLDVLEHTAEISTWLCRINGFAAGYRQERDAGYWEPLDTGRSEEEADIPDELPARPVDRQGFSVMSETLCQFTAVTLYEPTWCQQCNGFLWGFKEQGVRCGRCFRTVCSEDEGGGAGLCGGVAVWRRRLWNGTAVRGVPRRNGLDARKRGPSWK